MSEKTIKSIEIPPYLPAGRQGSELSDKHAKSMKVSGRCQKKTVKSIEIPPYLPTGRQGSELSDKNARSIKVSGRCQKRQ